MTVATSVPAGAADRSEEADLATEIATAIGLDQYHETADFPVEISYGWNTLAATENGNPLYWDEAVAEALTGGMTLPVTTLSLWMRPHRWSPGQTGEQVALQTHFDLKAALGLPEAIISENSCAFCEPVRPGDVIRHHQVLRSVSGLKSTRLGAGRFWVIDVVYANQSSELVGVESYTGFGYRRRADGDAETTLASAGATTGPAPASTPSVLPPTADSGPGSARPDSALRRVSDRRVSDRRVSDRRVSDHSVSDTEAADSSHAASSHAADPAVRWAKDDPTHHQLAVGDRIAPISHKVTATTVVLGALASRDWRPMHHDHRFAVERNGTRDIFLNTPNQAAWFERAITDWTGPRGRIGRMSFRMNSPVFPGDRMMISAEVTDTDTDDAGCGWAELGLALTVGGQARTTGAARVAVPVSASDNPWARRGEDWRP